MKTFILCFTAVFSISAFARSVTIRISDDEKDGKPAKAWHCEVSAFTNTYEGFGATKTEAKYKAQKNCTEKNHEMHCRDVKCEGDSEEDAGKGWVCKISAFTDNFEAYANSKTEAKYKVAKKCKAQYNEMHCTDVKCESED